MTFDPTHIAMLLAETQRAVAADTRRERIATAVVAGWAAHRDRDGYTQRRTAELAVAQADALIAVLDGA